MSPVQLIDKYYPQENELKHILVAHSAAVARKALSMAEAHPELAFDRRFVEKPPCSTISVYSELTLRVYIVRALTRIFATDI